MLNIADVVAADKNIATMLRSLKAAGTEIELSKPGGFTVTASTVMEQECSIAGVKPLTL